MEFWTFYWSYDIFKPSYSLLVKKGFRKNKMLSDFPEKTSAPIPLNSDLKIALQCLS